MFRNWPAAQLYPSAPPAPPILSSCRVAAAEDGLLRFQDLSPLADSPSSSVILAGRDIHMGGGYVKTVAFSPSGAELAVFMRDGSLQLLSDFKPAPAGDADAAAVLPAVRRLRTHVNMRMAEMDDASTPTHFPLAWHPSGEALAVGTQKGVMVLSRSAGWDAVYTMTHPSVRPDTHGVSAWTGSNALVWSPNGRYLAVVDGRRLLTIWDCTVGGINVTTGAPNVRGGVYASIAMCMHGYIPIVAQHTFGAGAGTYDDFSQAATSAGASGSAVESFKDLSEASDRITGVVWGRDGRFLYHIGTQGSLGYVAVKATLEADGGGSVVGPLVEAEAKFPLPADAADAADPGSGAGAEGFVAADDEIDADTLAFLEKAEAKHAAERAAEASARKTSRSDGDAATSNSSGSRMTAKGKASAAGKLLEDNAEESDVEDERDDGAAAGSGAGAGASAGAGDDDADLSLAAVKRKYGFVDDDGDDDEGGGLRRLYDGAGAGAGSSGGAVGALADDFSSVQFSILDRLLKANREVAHKEVRRAMGFVTPQRPFQPTATKAGKEGGRHFLAWNGIAAVVARDQLIGGERVDTNVSVDFADAARFKSISFNDKARFTMAAVCEHGVFLGAPYVPPLGGSRTEDAPSEGSPAQLRFFCLDGFGSASAQRWALSLPVFAPRRPEAQMPLREPEATFDGVRRERDTSVAAESPVAVAVGDGWAAAGTDAQLLRIFRSGGSQDAIFAVPGPIVTVVGRGALCAVIYHAAAPAGEKQHLAAEVYMIRVGVDSSATGGSVLPRLLTRVTLPMRPRVTLNWAGMAPNGWLMAHDSDGFLYAAGAGCDWAWMPVCDTKHAAAHPELFAGAGGDAGEVRPPSHERDTSDAFFPLDVVMAPASLAKGSGVDEGKHAVAPPDGHVPLLQAVLIKGGRATPQCSSPLPLRNWLPLRLPLLDGLAAGAAGGRAEVLRLEEASVRHEALRIQREWMLSQGLAPVSGDSLSLSAASAAASAAQRGEVGDAADAGAQMKAAIDEGVRDAQRYGIAIDKTVLAQADALLQAGMEFRASQLGGRLHIDKSFAMAQKFAGRYGAAAGAASDRFGQMLLARQALASGEVLSSAPPPDSGAASALAIAELAKVTRGAGGAGAAIGGAAIEAMLDGTAGVGGAAGAGGAPRSFGLAKRLAEATTAAAQKMAVRMASEAAGAGAGAGAGARAAGGSSADESSLPPTAALLAGLAGGSSAHAASSAGGSSRAGAGAGAGAGARGTAAAAAAAAPGPAVARSGGAINPFAPKPTAAAAASTSPSRGHGGKRAREISGLEALAVASPQRGAVPAGRSGGAAGGAGSAGGGAILNRQSSFAQEAREAKRQRQREEQN